MAGPLGNPTPFSAPPYMHPFRPASSMSANRFDEGYSEDTRSQSGSDMVMRTDVGLGEGDLEPASPFSLPDWVMALSEHERSEFAYAILRSLRTSSIAAIVEKLNPLLHLDPVIHLPPEITFQILSYLDPETLLRASTLSRAWRNRVLDSPLWKLLFRLEGWNSNFPQVRAYEEGERQKRAEFKEKERKTRPRAAEDMDYDKPSSKKRVRERQLFGDGPASENSSIYNTLEPLSSGGYAQGNTWEEQHGPVEADDSPLIKAEDKMEGISFHDASPAVSPTEVTRRERKQTAQTSDFSPTSLLANPLGPAIQPSLLLPGPDAKINWQFLYKQKRRLEDNWDAGRFSNFQLPHPNHPDEAHTECVYTIQYSGKYLVSGSRDKTIRIWNLDTLRLVHPPLAGHTASVLCLQFDERPDQDIVVSGGSDCRVILWRFSTGRIIKEIDKAHSESVLNLRFDDRYLVTCSKDKTIKVWNRKEMWPTDDTYPSSTIKSSARFPSYIINMQEQVENSHLHFKPLQPYSLIMTLEGHGAAVNAIQILDGQIVSASGDRSVKVWDVRTGACTRTFSGHSKGIACVQFDGRRIVSGSSDETVRIFDRATGAEVACLSGHTNLVRTVQAQFGDLPGNEEELEAEARAVDRNFFEAQTRGLLSDKGLNRAQRRARNAGSRDPKAIFAYGAKLPPGGGGSKWARIVSGSYDETVIIWKRGTDGAWEKAKTLYQNDAVRAAGGRPRRPVVQAQANANQGSQQAQQNAQAPAQQNNFQALAQQAQAQAQAAQSLAQQAQALHAASQTVQGTTTNNASMNTSNTTATPSVAAQATTNGGQAGAPTQQGGATNAAPHHHHHHHHHPPHPLAGPLNNQGTNSRVFKLQFDARRIICCSQDPTIVGWDFANNDKDIVLASQFFGDSY
ncbi:WD40 repeat-like protein [Cucurbitaria berberidis CBS 394.84]|uniref:WD40 repeat-like protein n=1 Tax=Cucurbitaria berberidis CBS 394.84 TaxID=1168544 RepID=A0A9P4L7T2_9PLEO|nr:WD40 repeat-like protein [Cucurbitaria berberidis CBS 394.84]KAF1845315.1 WD40 repeat-like protein [Cucurbitaria berberidis CBS 394.84]